MFAHVVCPPACACATSGEGATAADVEMYCCRRRPIAALRRPRQSRAGRPSGNIIFLFSFPFLSDCFSSSRLSGKRRPRKTAPPIPGHPYSSITRGAMRTYGYDNNGPVMLRPRCFEREHSSISLLASHLVVVIRSMRYWHILASISVRV